MMKNNKGQVSIAFTTAWIGIGAIVSIITSYYTSQASITDKINQSAIAFYSNISDDRQRITAVETDLKTIKESQIETRQDVKEILKAVK